MLPVDVPVQSTRALNSRWAGKTELILWCVSRLCRYNLSNVFAYIRMKDSAPSNGRIARRGHLPNWNEAIPERRGIKFDIRFEHNFRWN